MTLRAIARAAGRGAARVGWWAAFGAAWVAGRALRPLGGRRGRGAAWWGVYDAYMDSESWQRARVRAIRRAQGRCSRRRCGVSAPLDVHHRTYWLIGLDPWFVIVAICRSCHEATHGFRIPRGRSRNG